MKIKQHGQIPNWELEVICKRCTAVNTIERADDMYAKSHPTGKMDGIYQDYAPRTFHCICKECGAEINIASEDIREDVKAEVKTKD